jgi:hypothetical protein
MKKVIQIPKYAVSIILLITSPLFSSAQKKDTLALLKLPEITAYKPSITTGWVGQYVYELHFDGVSSIKTAKGNIPYYRVKTDRILTGYVEFPMQVKGAIRSNQPDGYNKERYEGWIRSGSSSTWSKVVDSIKTILYSGIMGDIVNTGTIETNYARNSNGNWVEGWLEGCDLQIDYTTGQYSFGLPVVSFEMEEDVWGVKTNFKPEKKEPFQRKQKARLNYRNVTYLQFDMPKYVTDSFIKGQKEITIRKRIPVLLEQTTTQGSKTITLPVVKGYMDFYLILKKAPFTESGTTNKSAAAPDKPTDKPATAEPGKEKPTEAVPTPENNTKGKTGINGLKKKVVGIIRNH